MHTRLLIDTLLRPVPSAYGGAVLDDAFAQVEQASRLSATSPWNKLPEPTKAQQESGEYSMGRAIVQGLPIRIENVRGSVRSGVGVSGKPWSNRMAAHYGFIAGTTGNDGDGVDVFLGPLPESPNAWVINQRKADGIGFDEHKVCLGFPNEQQARDAYQLSYDRDWRGLMSVVPVTIPQLKWWLKSGDMSRPFSADKLPIEGQNIMDKVLWNNQTEPVTTTLAQLMYDLRVSDKDEGLMLDAVTMAELMGHPDIEGVMTLDALVVQVARMTMKMDMLQKVMGMAAGNVKPTGYTISDPVRSRGVLQVMVLFQMDDGQTISVWFHNPDSTPAKLTPMDELISWKWMLNKKDVTIVVAPERGQELNVREVARRVMRLVERNTEAFMRANARLADRIAAEKALDEEIVVLEGELSDLNSKIDKAREDVNESTRLAQTDPGPRTVLTTEAFSALERDMNDAALAVFRTRAGEIPDNAPARLDNRSLMSYQVGETKLFTFDMAFLPYLTVNVNGSPTSVSVNNGNCKFVVHGDGRPADTAGLWNTDEQFGNDGRLSMPIESLDVPGATAAANAAVDAVKAYLGLAEAENAAKVATDEDGADETASPVALMELLYPFDGTDAFKTLVAPSISELDYSAFQSAKVITEAVKVHGGAVRWDVASMAVTDAIENRMLSEEDEVDEFDAEYEFDACEAKDPADNTEKVMDGDFKGHPFRGNQFRKASAESGTAVQSSQHAKHAESKSDKKAAAKAHKTAHFAHMAAAVNATGKAKKYHKTMAKFHGAKGGVPMLDSVLDSVTPSSANDKRIADIYQLAKTDWKAAGEAVKEYGEDKFVNDIASGVAALAIEKYQKEKPSLIFAGSAAHLMFQDYEKQVLGGVPLNKIYQAGAVGNQTKTIFKKVIDTAWGKGSADYLIFMNSRASNQREYPAGKTPEWAKEKALDDANGAYMGQEKKAIAATANLIKFYRAFIRSDKSFAKNPMAEKAGFWGDDIMSKAQAQAALTKLIDLAINAKAGGTNQPQELDEKLQDFAHDARVIDEYFNKRIVNTGSRNVLRVPELKRMYPEIDNPTEDGPYAKRRPHGRATLDAVDHSWHSKTMEAMKHKSEDELSYILKDATEAADAGEKMDPPNPKSGQYRDEAHYAAMELARRKKGGKQLEGKGPVVASITLDSLVYAPGYQVVTPSGIKAVVTAVQQDGMLVLDGVDKPLHQSRVLAMRKSPAHAMTIVNPVFDEVRSVGGNDIVGMITFGGVVVGRAEVGSSDGKAMIYTGASGDTRSPVKNYHPTYTEDADSLRQYVDSLFAAIAAEKPADDAAPAKATRDQAFDALTFLRSFMGKPQIQAVMSAMRGEEAQYFYDKMVELQDRIRRMPKVYGQDGLGNRAIAYLHYFKGAGDWYITEKDTGKEQLQAFGQADLGYGPEKGYISISELIANGVELDFNFKPRTLAAVNGDPQDKPEPDDKDEPVDPNAVDPAEVKRVADLSAAFNAGYTAFGNGEAGQTDQNSAFKALLLDYQGVGNEAAISNLEQAFTNGFAAGKNAASVPAPAPSPVPAPGPVPAPEPAPVPNPEPTPPTVDPAMQADKNFLQSLIDGTADYFAPDLFDRLEPLFTKYEADPVMMDIINKAATAFGNAATAEAQKALAS